MSPETLGYLMQYGPLAIMIGLLYVLFIRPQKKEQEKRNAMLAALKKGDHIVTLGGIYGTIVDISDKNLVVKVADKVEIKFAKSAVAHLQKEEE